MTPGISRKSVVGVLSLAKHIQDMRGIQGLEALVSEHLSTQPEAKEIPDEVMYELAETLRLDRKHVKQALSLYSNSEPETIELLRSIDTVPGGELKKAWLRDFAGKYSSLLQNFLSTNLNTPRPLNVCYNKNYFPWQGNADSKIFYGKNGFFIRAPQVGQIIFENMDYYDASKLKIIPVRIEITAHTPKFLALCSGPIREMTSTLAKVKDFNILYEPNGTKDF